MSESSFSRRRFLKVVISASAASTLAACGATPTPQIIEKEVTKIVAGTPQVIKETVVVKETSLVEKVVVPTQAPQGPVELVAAWLASQDYWQAQLDILKKTNPDITVKCIEAPVAGTWSWSGFFDKVATLIAGGVTIDTIRVPIEGAKLVVALGIVQPIDDYLAVDSQKENLDDIDQALRNAFIIRGKTYAMPSDFNDMLIWYNTAHFEEAGIEKPNGKWTYDQFLETAIKLTKKNNGQVERFGFMLPNGYHFQSIPWAFNRDASHLSDDWNKATMDDPKFLDAIDFMRNMVWKHKAASIDPDPIKMMYTGKASMIGAGRWPTQTFKQNKFETCDVTLWPNGGAAFTEFGVGAQWMSKTTSHPKEVWEVLKMFVSKEAQTASHAAGSAISTRKSIALSVKAEGGVPNDSLFYQAFETASPKPVPAPADFNSIEEPTKRGYQQTVVANEKPTKEAWLAIQEEVSKIIAERPADWKDL